MLAAVLRELHRPLTVEEVEVQEPQAGEVLVRVMASGVCRTDLHAIEGTLPAALPAILGHEGAGVVEQVGPGVTSVQAGDHVILALVPACGHCQYCAVGRPNLCIRRASLPSTMRDGSTRFRVKGQPVHHFIRVSSFGQYTVVPEAGAIPIRRDAPLESVCLIGCGVMTGVGAVINTARVGPGQSVLVVGCGGVGLSVVLGARLAGAWPIIAADVRDHKLTLARDLGATHVINNGQEDLVERSKELTDGLGVHYAFEAISTGETIRAAFDSLRAGGMCVVVGVAPPGTEVRVPSTALLQERVLTGSAYGSARMAVDIPMLVDLFMAGRLPLDRLIGSRLSLDEVNTALDLLRRGEVARSVIEPW